MSIAPGTTILLEIRTTPRAERARKTLTRICRKDPRVNQHHRQQKAKRPSRRAWVRGGKFWHHQMRTQPAVRLAAGSRYTLRATVDVLRDLESVGRWVIVRPA